MCPVSLAADTPALAELYDKGSVDRQFKAGRALVERLGLRPGEAVLDVGCGTGLLAAYAAERVGRAGRVVGIDPLPFRIQIAQRRAKQVANLEFGVDDAYGLASFSDESFDVVLLNAVFHWLPLKLRALANFQRVLKRGGRLGLGTASKEHPNRIQQVLSREPYDTYPEAGIPHRVSADELRQQLEATGFEVSTLELESHVLLHESVEAALQHARASSFGNFLMHLPPELRERAEREISVELERGRTPEGVRQESARLIAVAIKR